eukprot:jgi/Ulvmu1/4297/UM002_0017.1
MGLPCSKSKAKGEVLRSRAKVLSRGQMAHPSSLADLCVNTLADHHEGLSATDVEERIGRNSAQRLLNALIVRGKLNHDVAMMFGRAYLWQLELSHYPGAGNAMFEVLSSGSLTMIDLSGTRIDDEAMRIVAGNTQLHTLNLSKTCVTSGGLALLCFNPHLSRLELDECRQLDLSIPALQSLSSLQHVSVSGSRFLSPCHIISALKDATKITYLDLSWCQGSAGSSHRALLSLPRLQQLSILSLDNACVPVELFTCILLLPRISKVGACGYVFPCTDDIPFALLSKIFRVPSASTAEDALLTGRAVRRIQGASTSAVQVASMRGVQPVVDTEVKAANVDATSTQMRPAGSGSSVELDNYFDGPAAPMRTPALLLMRLQALTSLHLRWANVSSQAWSLLARLPSLQHLDVAFTNAEDATVHTLASLQKLTYLNLDSTWVTDLGMRNISSFPALQHLNLSDTKLGNSGLDHLQTLRKLKGLNLSYTNITDPGVAHLTALTTLTYLSVDSRLISDAGLVHLTSLTTLRALDLFGCKLTKAGAIHIAKLPQLHWLEAAGGVLCDEGVNQLRCLASLTYLSIAQNRKVTDISYQSLCKLSLLRHLNISGTSMTLDSMDKFIVHMMNLEALAVYGLRVSKARMFHIKQSFPGIDWAGLAPP